MSELINNYTVGAGVEPRKVRLTKSGKPDGRAISSKKNLEKGKRKVQEILEKAKGKGQAPYNPSLEGRLKEPQGSFEEYETDEEEEFEIRAINKGEPLINPTIQKVEEIIQPIIETPKIEPEILNNGVGKGLPYIEIPKVDEKSTEELKRILEEAELTKKEIIELKRVIKEQQHREEQRMNNEVQKELNRARQQAYGRLNSLSQQMSMKF